MFRKIRITLSIMFFVAITLLFLDFTGTMHAYIGWMAKIQFFPALLALNVGVVVALVLLTLILGRVYCSVICPMGVFQDVISWFSARRKKKRTRFSYSKELKWLRYSVFALFAISIIVGIGAAVALLDPYGSYGRIASSLFAPLYRWGNNLLAFFAERADSYAFYQTDVWLKSIATFTIAAVTFIAIFVLAWRNGRTYCNTICPVGTILGFISRFAMFRPVIDQGKCVKCSRCTKTCKASCLDYKNHKIDYSRCVACMDCLESCSKGAISLRYCWGKKADEKKNTNSGEGIDESRRSFIASSLVITATAVVNAQGKKVDGGLAVIEDKKIPDRKNPIVPAGSISLRHFTRHCVGCQLCVSACPNSVLRPSSDLSRLMMPEMSYERGYCRPECKRCSEVCPAGAILPISLDYKSSIQIGHAVWIKKNCIPLVDNVECGNCARHCPSGAIIMVNSDSENPDSVKIPIINEERCIGCGACENLCPARPFSAIYVEGNGVHGEI